MGHLVHGLPEPQASHLIHTSLPDQPSLDSIPLPEPEIPDEILDVASRDEHVQLEDGFMANLLTLGALPDQDCLSF